MTRHMRTWARAVSLGVPSSLLTIQSAPPVEVMPWATMNRAAQCGGGGLKSYGDAWERLRVGEVCKLVEVVRRRQQQQAAAALPAHYSLTTVMRPELPKPTRAFLIVRILKMTWQG